MAYFKEASLCPLFIQEASHTGNIYGGFNPLLVAKKIASKLELNTDFCDVVNGEATPPPSVVY